MYTSDAWTRVALLLGSDQDEAAAMASEIEMGFGAAEEFCTKLSSGFPYRQPPSGVCKSWMLSFQVCAHSYLANAAVRTNGLSQSVRCCARERRICGSKWPILPSSKSCCPMRLLC